MELAEYERKYPNYCKTCKGWGRIKYSDLPFHDCHDCLEKQLCPRCRGKVDDTYYKCSRCEWHPDVNEGLPGSNAG